MLTLIFFIVLFIVFLVSWGVSILLGIAGLIIYLIVQGIRKFRGYNPNEYGDKVLELVESGKLVPQGYGRGEEVEFKPNLIVGESYGGIVYRPEMEDGDIRVIEYIYESKAIKLENGLYISDKMVKEEADWSHYDRCNSSSEA